MWQLKGSRERWEGGFIMSAMDSIIRFSNVIGHLEQRCEQLIRVVSKLGWRPHWDRGTVRQANFPGDKAVAIHLRDLYRQDGCEWIY